MPVIIHVLIPSALLIVMLIVTRCELKPVFSYCPMSIDGIITQSTTTHVILVLSYISISTQVNM